MGMIENGGRLAMEEHLDSAVHTARTLWLACCAPDLFRTEEDAAAFRAMALNIEDAASAARNIFENPGAGELRAR
ncbi:hypothetical protein IYW40_07130 [Methylocystis sp. H4A]|uniref:hypothetical protein n=1 Tax=Methylocystis sp. H4A TaxID=2785788 RepID=UPI0018C31B3F|nr:hypothetical protein [Methylocystis sp. H4A]MBG0801255.1 hypothetical protein [Methylocystis sp. H4A]